MVVTSTRQKPYKTLHSRTCRPSLACWTNTPQTTTPCIAVSSPCCSCARATSPREQKAVSPQSRVTAHRGTPLQRTRPGPSCTTPGKKQRWRWLFFGRGARRECARLLRSPCNAMPHTATHSFPHVASPSSHGVPSRLSGLLHTGPNCNHNQTKATSVCLCVCVSVCLCVCVSVCLCLCLCLCTPHTHTSGSRAQHENATSSSSGGLSPAYFFLQCSGACPNIGMSDVNHKNT